MNNRGFSLWDQFQEKWLSRRGLIRGAAGTMFPAKALADISDPSQITDFDGFVGLTHIRGGGMGTDTTSGAMTGLAFQADMGFNQGKFIGSASVYKQIHDYNVHVDRNDVFWMIPVRHDAVQADFDSQRARLRVRGMDVFDDHDIANSLSQGLGLPAIGSNPAIPGAFSVRAKVSFDI